MLKYLTRPEGYAKTKDLTDPVLNAILRDGQEAMRQTRTNARKWGIKLDRLGAMGFSAGSHLAIRLAMSAQSSPESRPDFLALLYSSSLQVPATLLQKPGLRLPLLTQTMTQRPRWKGESPCIPATENTASLLKCTSIRKVDTRWGWVSVADL